jgi:hypothetical protein
MQADRKDMYDQQSQASSTHQTPFDEWLKKTLRLNRDPVLFFAHKTAYQELEGGFLVTATLKHAVVKACLLSSIVYR